ncbi:MAG TPA: hypothetical protein VGG65_00140 [Thermoanaerobaculia bacterium]
MELTGVHVEDAARGRVRLVGEVRYADAGAPADVLWFDVSEQYASQLSTTGNPWLVCLAPLAAVLGEPLHIGLPIDRLLARNVRELLRIWSVWYPAVREVPLEIEVSDVRPAAPASESAAFFSGGVDSFFSVLRNEAPRPEALPASDLILVHGFEFPLENARAFALHREKLGAAAGELGKRLVDVVTNLRETRLREASWAYLWHGPALASVGLVLENRYRLLMIASTSPYGELDPWGSHPMTDALLSTGTTRVIHDGAEFTRLDKIRYLSRSDTALRWLHVCFREISDTNCGRCRKCLLTMLSLVLFGALDRCPTFRAGGPDLGRVSRILFQTEAQRRGVRRTRALAVREGRKDIARAITRALRRSRILAPLLSALERLGRTRGLSRLVNPMRRSLLATVVR